MANRGIKSERPARSLREQKRRQALTAAKVEARFIGQLRNASKTSYGRRLHRAEVKLEEAKRIVAEWLDSGWEVRGSTEGGDRIFSVRQCRPLNEELEHLVYEVAEGLLATLDQLAFAIAAKNCPSWTQLEQEKSAFPIRDKEPPNASSRKQYTLQVQCWPQSAVEELEALQPYNYMPDAALAPLWRLRELANRGKHRIIVAARSNMNVEVGINNGRLDLVHAGGVSELTEHPQQFLRLARSSHGDIDVRPDVQIRFGPGSLLSGHRVVESLDQQHDYVVNTVLRALMPYT